MTSGSDWMRSAHWYPKSESGATSLGTAERFAWWRFPRILSLGSRSYGLHAVIAVGIFLGATVVCQSLIRSEDWTRAAHSRAHLVKSMRSSSASAVPEIGFGMTSLYGQALETLESWRVDGRSNWSEPELVGAVMLPFGAVSTWTMNVMWLERGYQVRGIELVAGDGRVLARSTGGSEAEELDLRARSGPGFVREISVFLLRPHEAEPETGHHLRVNRAEDLLDPKLGVRLIAGARNGKSFGPIVSVTAADSARLLAAMDNGSSGHSDVLNDGLLDSALSDSAVTFAAADRDHRRSLNAMAPLGPIQLASATSMTLANTLVSSGRRSTDWGSRVEGEGPQIKDDLRYENLYAAADASPAAGSESFPRELKPELSEWLAAHREPSKEQTTTSVWVLKPLIAQDGQQDTGFVVRIVDESSGRTINVGIDVEIEGQGAAAVAESLSGSLPESFPESLSEPYGSEASGPVDADEVDSSAGTVWYFEGAGREPVRVIEMTASPARR